MKKLQYFSLLIVFALLFSNIARSQIVILSGVKGGSYEQFAKDLQRISIEPIEVLNSNGSVDNFRQLAIEKTVDITFLQQDVLVHQQLKDLEKGTNFIEDIRVLMLLAKEEIHLIARKDGNINSLQDLSGRKVAIGAESQGTHITSLLIKEIAEIDWIDVTDTLSFDKVLADLQEKKIDAFFFVGAAPVSKLTKLPKDSNVKVVPIADPRLREIYVKTTIPKGTYPVADYDVETYAVKSVIATNIENEEEEQKENIRKLLVTIKRRIKILRREGHPKWSEVDFNLQDLDWQVYDAADEIFNSEEALKSQIYLVSGVSGGSYHQFANDIKSISPTVIVKTSKGSVDNLNQLITKPEVDATFLQYDVLLQQRLQDEEDGTNYTENIRILLPLAREQIHLIARKDSKIKKLRRLRNKNVAIGTINQGTYVTSRLIKEITNTKWNDVPLAFDEVIEALENGEIDAFFFVGTAPVKAFTQLGENANVKLVPMQNKRLDEIYETAIIPPGTYPWQTEAVETYAVKSVLATNITDETEIKRKNIKTILTDIKRKIGTLRAQGHPKWKEIDFDYGKIDWPQYSTQIELLSGVKGGSYEQFANDIKNISIDSITIRTSNGAVDNFNQMIAKKDIDATFLQEDVLTHQQLQDLQKGTDYIKNIRILMPLANEEIHLVTLSDSRINSLKDLSMMKVAIGSDIQGTSITANLIKEISEMEWIDVKNTLYLDSILFDLLEGKIDAFFFVGASPVSKLKEYPPKSRIKLVPIKDPRLAEIYQKTTIPANTYRWAKYDVETYAVKSVLATNIYDETETHRSNVIKLLKDIKSRMDELKANGHPKWSEVRFNLMELDWQPYEGADDILNPKDDLKPEIALLSGVKGGSYNQFANDIADIATNEVTVHPSKGSVNNFKELILRENYFVTFLQHDVLIDQKRKDKQDGTNYTDNIRVLLPLADEEIHLISRDESYIKSIKDLRNRRVAIGTLDQGTYLTARLIKEVTNARWIDVPLSFDSAFSALYNKKIDAFFFVGTSPVSKLAKIPERANFKLLPITNSKLEEIYKPTVIPEGTYKWQNSDVRTYAVKSVLATNITDETFDQHDNIVQLLIDIKNGILKLRSDGHIKWQDIDFNFNEVNWPIYEDSKEIFNQYE